MSHGGSFAEELLFATSNLRPVETGMYPRTIYAAYDV